MDTNHIEFTPHSGSTRTVANIFNEFGALTSNTDGFGHGTHCAGKLVTPIIYKSHLLVAVYNGN